MSLVATVKHVEKIRDGGSFAVWFMDRSQVEYTLWFPIVHRMPGTKIEQSGHRDPFVARIVHFADDTTVGWRAEDVRLVTWDEALSLLEEIRPLISDTDVWSRSWFKKMIGVAQRSGKPPPDSSGMRSPPRTAGVRAFDIEGQSVRLIETEDGGRTWLCGCAKFQQRAKEHPEGFCAHTVAAISQCIEDGSIDIDDIA